MNTSIQTFDFAPAGAVNATAVRVIEIDNQPWFVAKDVCRVIGHTNPTMAVRSLDASEKAQNFLGGISVNVVSESGLYKLVLRAQRTNPKVVEFQNWVTKVVLPAIRKDGAYVMGEEKVATGELDEEAFVLKAIEIMQRKIERLRIEKEQAEAKVEELEPKAAVGDMVEQHLRTVSRVGRTFVGVNSQTVKRDLMRHGYLYRDHTGAYRVYARFRTQYFIERLSPEYGKVDIFVGPKGYEVLVDLYNRRELTMLKGF
jgi:prophage antirepressor-like protein